MSSELAELHEVGEGRFWVVTLARPVKRDERVVVGFTDDLGRNCPVLFKVSREDARKIAVQSNSGLSMRGTISVALSSSGAALAAAR